MRPSAIVMTMHAGTSTRLTGPVRRHEHVLLHEAVVGGRALDLRVAHARRFVVTQVSVRALSSRDCDEPVGVVPDLGVRRVDLLDGVDVAGLDGLEEAVRQRPGARLIPRTVLRPGQCSATQAAMRSATSSRAPGGLLEVVVARRRCTSCLSVDATASSSSAACDGNTPASADGVHDERRQVQAGEVRAGPAVGVGEAPHVQPAAARATACRCRTRRRWPCAGRRRSTTASGGPTGRARRPSSAGRPTSASS